ncbi:MAG: hypothetical protein ACTS7E_04220 [Arsenophonus sp. NC-CH8-MAG3]
MLISGVCGFGDADVRLLLINLLNDLNNREMICHKKSTLQISAKLDITYNILHELIRNADSNLIGTALDTEL